VEQVRAHWRDESYAPGAEADRAADAAVAELQDRGSPSHDGEAARLVGFRERDGGLELELQPVRWSLRLVDDEGAQSISALCVVRAADGRWLAGRRAAWLAAWAGRWALGAGGAVEVGENPALTLARELDEEWSVTPERLSVEALVQAPSGLVLLVGLAWLPPGAEVSMDPEHDAHEWWPADVGQWPEHADAPLRAMAGLLDG
jgi:ADP-ribose pyrophosphatase YjhB (NUDIX family)